MISCVVYASKFKPEVAAEGLHAVPVAPSAGGINRKPRETTTNAHDWVWLGMRESMFELVSHFAAIVLLRLAFLVFKFRVRY